MTDRELRKLRRMDLLELLIQQDEEIENLKARLEKAEGQLKSREIKMDTAGSLAEASLSISGVFEAAQDAATRYLENIEAMSRKQEEIYAEMKEKARREADALLTATEERCRKMENETYLYCERMQKRARKEESGDVDAWANRTGKSSVNDLTYSSIGA